MVDGTVSFAEMKSLLADAYAKAQANGTVTQALFDDLTLIAKNLGNGVYTSSYVASIFQQLVLGAETRNQADRVWNGGSVDASSEYYLASSGDGATVANFEMLIDEWFKGLDLPDASVPGSKIWTSTYQKMSAAPLWDNAAGDVSTHDVHQGSIGDCAVLSGLNELVDNHPEILKQIIVDNGDGTYGVRFYANGDEIWVTVDNQLPYQIATYSDGSVVEDENGDPVKELYMNNSGKDFASPLWASLIEKAFAQVSSTGLFDHPAKVNGYDNMSGNVMGYILKDYTNTATFDIEYDDANWEAEKAIVIAALDAGDDVMLNSREVTYNSAGLKLFASNHAYAVLGYDSTTDKFTVRNPWGDVVGKATYVPQFEVSWNGLAADRGGLTIDASASLKSPFRIETTGAYAITDQGVTISSLVRITELDGKDVDYVRLKVIGDGVIDLNGATDHADATEQAEGYVVVSSSRLSTVTYTAGASDTDYLMIGAINSDTYGPTEFFQIKSDARTIQVVSHRTRVLSEGETIGVASLSDVSGVHNAAKTWYQASVLNDGGGTFGFSSTPSSSTDTSEVNPYAYGADYQSLTYTAPQAYGQITLEVQITDDLRHKSAFTDFAVWVGNTAAVAIQNFNNGALSKAQAVADTSANIVANLDSLAAMVDAKTLKYIGLTDDVGGRPTVHLTGAQIAENFAALAVITDSLRIVVDGGIDAATDLLDGQLVALGSLTFEAGAPTGPVLSATPTVAAYLANVAAYDAKADGFTITDTTKALTDASATLLGDAAVKGLVVVDTAAAIVAGIDALAKLPVTSVTATDGAVLVISSVSKMTSIIKNDAKVLAAFLGTVTFEVNSLVSGGVALKAVYAADGKQISGTYSDGRVAAYGWNADGSYEIHWTGITGQAYSSYDAVYGTNGKLASLAYSDGRAATYTWNADGSYKIHWTGITGQTYTSYDVGYLANGKPASLAYSDGRAGAYTWNADGTYKVHWTGITGQTYSAYDAAYGANGKLASIAYSDGRVVTYGTDGKTSSVGYADGRLATYDRKADGSYVIHWTGIAGGSYTSYDATYGTDGKLATIGYPDGRLATYGADGKQVSMAYSDGRLTTYERKADGSYVMHWTGITGGSYSSYDAAYGADGKQTSTTYPDGRKGVYDCAADGSYVIHWTGVTGQAYTSYDVAYGADGKTSTVTYSNGLVSTYAWNADGSFEVETKGAKASSYDQTDVIYRASGKAETEVFLKGGVAVRVENWNADGTLANDTSLTGKATHAAPFGGRSSIDLFAFSPSATTLGFSEDASGTFGTLTLTQGKQHLAMTLLGQYAASDFSLTSDGFGGSLVSVVQTNQGVLAGANA